MRNLAKQKISAVLLYALSGGITGFLLIAATVIFLVISLDDDRVSFGDFTNNSYFMIWLVLKIFAFALDFILGYLLWARVRQRYYKPYSWGNHVICPILLISLVILIVNIGAFSLIFDQNRILNSSYQESNYIIISFGVLILLTLGIGIVAIVLPAIQIICGIQRILQKKFKNQNVCSFSLSKYMFWRKELTSATLALGLMIGLLTLAAASLRQAGIRAKLLDNNLFPIEFILLYGLLCTFLLVLIYLPVSLSLNKIGHSLCNTLYPLTLTSTQYSDITSLDKWMTQYSYRKKCQELLQLEINSLQNWTSELAILAPLFGSFIPTLLNKLMS